ncbi:MAG TPA: arginine decarboxylase, pyruvoyl-dependent [Planctomycetota bacterium]|nr:arginine decarboxylase, pyruvoyl-dependent [Planctomycetota bacterium]
MPRRGSSEGGVGYVPRRLFLTNGVGRHREKLTSFEMALRDAGIASFNLVKVSSIFPPHCKIIPKRLGLQLLKPGQIVHVVMSENATNEPHRLLAASVGVAIPKNPDHYGYLSEHHSYGQTDDAAGDYAEDLAASMLATILGVDFDPDKSYDEKKEIWRFSGQIVRTFHTTQSALGDKSGLWTTVIACAVFV